MDASITIRLLGLSMPEQGVSSVASRSKPEMLESEVSDETLIVRVGEGSREALALLFRRYARLVRAVAMRIVRDSSEADDLLQEVFLFVHRKAGTYDRSQSTARSWLVQVTYHRAIDRRRYLQSRHFYTRADLDTEVMGLRDSGPDRLQNDPFVDAGLEKTELQTIFSGLSKDQQKTLQLFFFEGYTFPEIGVALEQSLGNVKNHYYRGLDRLRKQIFTARNKKTRHAIRR
jgi:RNA polymerase sigma-70 factor (ECF subfamily)